MPASSTELDPNAEVSIPEDQTAVPGAQDGAPAPDGQSDAEPGTKPEGSTQGDTAPEPKTALEAAQKAIGKSSVQGKEAAPTSDKPNQVKTDDPAQKVLSATDKAVLEQNPGLKQRFQELLAENKEAKILKVAKQKNEEAIAQLTPKAGVVDELHGFLQQSNLTGEDFGEALRFAALVRNDPEKAYTELIGLVQQLAPVVGAVLPQELQAKVDANEIPPEVAAQLARSEAAKRLADGRWASERERRENEAKARQEADAHAAAEASNRTIQNALDSLYTQLKSSDPDWDKKLPFVEQAFEVALARKMPESVDEAVKMAREAVASVNERIRSFVPAPQAKNGQILPHGNPGSNQAPVPKSALEAAQNALAAMRG